MLRMIAHHLTLAIALLAFSAVMPVDVRASNAVRIKDLGRIRMGQDLQLTGVGLIIGLEGTGEGAGRSSPSR